MASRRRRRTAEFILRHPELEPAQLVELGSAAGLEITPRLVHAVRDFWSCSAPDLSTPAVKAERPPPSELRVSARTERRFTRLAEEIGFERAWELLELVAELLHERDPERKPGSG